MKWYKHDSTAHTDAKLKKVLLKYGLQGYGLYWYCLELIAKNVEKHNLTFELEEDTELISAAVNLHIDLVQEMMVYMVRLGLFEESDGRVFCLKMATRTDDYTLKLIRNQESVRTLSGHPRILSELREEKRTEEKRTEEKRTEQKDNTSTPAKAVVDAYHDILGDLPGVRQMTNKRRTRIRVLHNSVMEKDLEQWRSYFRAVSRSDFLMGRLPGKDWRASLDFLLTEKAVIGVLEGKYQ